MGLGYREHDPVSRRAEADISGNLFVKQGVAENGMALCGAGQLAFGVNKFDVLNGDIGTVHEDGELAVTSGAAVALGAEVMSDAAGKAVTATAGNHILGHARTAAAGADEEIIVQMLRGKHVKA